MFTGIIETVREIKKISGRSVSVAIPEDWKPEIGESVAVNGVCLTVTSAEKGLSVFDISPETYSKTIFRFLKTGSPVNLERALKFGDRISGHFVTGHIDGIARVLAVKKSGESHVFEFEAPGSGCLIEKGSVAVNGVSLTVFDLSGGSFKAAVIPHTYENTNLKYLKPGSRVNIEFDMLGKYVLKKSGGGLTGDFLKENGFF